MKRRIPLVAIAAGSLLFTYLFFAEYLPPLESVHITYDLDGYHFSLADYAFQAVSQGRFPEWDQAIYSGMSFVGNVQAALFYPPTWLLFAANLGNRALSFQSLEIFVLLHVWLAFVLCYLWLRGRQLDDLACILGAGVFAFSGYLCLQLQHLGLVVGYAWFPLGLMGIDEAAEMHSWRPYLKVVAASALCFLAGYPPLWVVFAICLLTYALFRDGGLITALGTGAGLIAALFVAMIQFLPTWEMTALMVRQERYGTGIKDPEFFLSYLLPNYFNFGMHVPVQTNFGKEYLYLGAPALLGFLYLFRSRNPRKIVPLFAVGLVALVFVTNPFDWIRQAIEHSSLFSELFRAWYFLAGITLAAAPLAAYGLDSFLRGSARRMPKWTSWLASGLLVIWSGWELVRWLRGGISFAYGWRSVYDPAIMLVLFTFAFWVLRSVRGATRIVLSVVLVLAVGIDYKVFGTSKRFNAAQGGSPAVFTPESFAAMDPDAFGQLRAHPEYRILLDDTGPSPMELRSAGLTTPQGFDPFMTVQYSQLLRGVGAHFRTERIFDLDPANQNMLKLLGVRYVAISGDSPLYSRLLSDPNYRAVGSLASYFRVFEYRGAQPPFGWETESTDQQTAKREWSPERREFFVRSTGGGRFTLHEQYLPGWRATVDGKAVAIEPWKGPFQAILVPPGDHLVRFEFRSRGLRIGAWITLLSVVSIAGLSIATGFARRSA